MYDFYFGRVVAERAPDRVVLRHRGRFVSGVGINYRSLQLRNGAVVLAGILTGGWTSAALRGRGLFGRVIASAVRVIAGRGCVFALAFMKEGNPSARVLRRLGAQMLPTTYLSGGPGLSGTRAAAGDLRIRPVPPGAVESAAAREIADGELRFHYPRPGEWRRQFLERPYPVDTLAVGDRLAIVERTPGHDRLQLMTGDIRDEEAALDALARRARRDHRGFLAFRFGDRGPRGAAPEGIVTEPGYLTLLLTCRETLAAALDLPARRTTRRRVDLASSGSAWFPGRWRVHAGDRM